MPYHERFIGWRYLRAKPFQTVMSMLGVVLGVFVVIVALSIFNGFQKVLRDNLLGSEAHLIVWKYGGPFKDYEALIDEIRAMPDVVAASPTVLSQALLQNRATKRRYGAQIRGVDPVRAAQVTDIDRYIKGGKLRFDQTNLLEIGRSKLPKGDTVQGGIILGSGLARRLGAHVGDPLLVFSDFKEGVRGEIYPVMRNLVVVDIYHSGLYEIDANVAYVSIDVAQELFDLPGLATQVEVRTTTPEKADNVQRAIVERYGLTYLPRTWKELRGRFFAAMELEKRLTFVILGLIILVAGFSISITLIMLVMEKVREIGILKAMGMARESILRIFMLNGALVGVLGALIGTGLSLIATWLLKDVIRVPLPADVYQIPYVPVEISWTYVLLVNGLSILICWLAALYPAFRAARFNPIEALRYEA